MRKPVRLLAVVVDGQVLTPKEHDRLIRRPVDQSPLGTRIVSRGFNSGRG